jgi:hypothetical protein
MKYLCLICAATLMEQMSDLDAQRHFEEYLKFTGEIRDSGNFLACDRPLPPRAAVTVRVRDALIPKGEHHGNNRRF